MREVKLFERATLRIEGAMNKDAIGNLVRRLYGSECVVININQQTSWSEISLWTYKASHIANGGGEQ